MQAKKTLALATNHPPSLDSCPCPPFTSTRARASALGPLPIATATSENDSHMSNEQWG